MVLSSQAEHSLPR